jgi:hypothetical protein
MIVILWLLIVLTLPGLPTPSYATARMSPVLSNVVDWVFENATGSCATISVFNNTASVLPRAALHGLHECFLLKCHNVARLRFAPEPVCLLQRRDKAPASPGNRIAIHRTGPYIGQSLYPQPYAAACQCAEHETVIGDIYFVLIIFIMTSYVCMFVAGER